MREQLTEQGEDQRRTEGSVVQTEARPRSSCTPCSFSCAVTERTLSLAPRTTLCSLFMSAGCFHTDSEQRLSQGGGGIPQTPIMSAVSGERNASYRR